ncbi:hypothetical protein D3C73_1261030 [compost metagenome]
MVNFHQFHQTGFFTVALHYKAAFALVMNMLVIQVRQLNERFVRFFEPVTHHAGIVIKLMDKS